MKKVLITTLVLSSFLFSCKKDKSDNPSPSTPTPSKTKTEYLTAHSWKLISSTADKEVDVDGDGNKSVDILGQRAACEKDNVYTFSSTGSPKTGSVDEGSTKCDSGDPQSTSFDWSWNDSETVVKLGKFFLWRLFTVDEFTVLQLDDTTLKVTYGGKDKNDVSYIATDVYAKP